MNQDSGKPDWTKEKSLSERLQVIQNFLTLTSGLLVKQAIYILYALPIQTKEQVEKSWEALHDAANEDVESASRMLIDLSIDSGNNLNVIHPEDYRRYGKLCGISFSLDDYTYLGSVKMGNDTKKWPILDGSQLFIGQTPAGINSKIGNLGIGGVQPDLRRPTNSVVLHYGNDSQLHPAYPLPHDGVPGIW